jgi:hypothetical protein
MPPSVLPWIRREGVVVIKVLLPVIFILTIVSYFHEFVLHAVEANIAINGLIIAAATYGIVLILARLIGAMIDYKVIERFGHEAMQGVYMPQLLEQPWLKRRHVRHYLGHIAQTGGTLSSAIQQNAIESELKALSGEYEHKLELPQFIVGFMIAMGLLGTFIGLLETLTGISGMLDGFGASGSNMDEQFMKLVVELRKPLAGMGIAFSASMFGLVTSLMLAVMMINLRRYVSHVVGCARNVMHNLIELGRANSGGSTSATQLTPEEIMAMAQGGGSKKPAAANIAEGDLTLQDLVYQAHDTSLMVANRIDGMTSKLGALVHAFESSLQSTQHMMDMLSFGPRLKETNEHMLAELKRLADGQVEHHKFAQRLIDVGGDTAHILGGIAAAQRESHAALLQSFGDLSGRLAKIEDTLGGELRVIASAQINQQALTQKFVDVGADTAHVVGSIVESTRESQAALTLSIRELASKLIKIEENTGDVGRYVGYIKDNFTKFGQQSNAVESISAGVGHSGLLLETLVNESRNLQKRLTSIQQDLREQFQFLADRSTHPSV